MDATEKGLDKGEIQSLPPGDHKDRRGLLLRVRPSGARSWVLRYGDMGHRVTLGPADARSGSLDLTKARSLARKKRGEMDAAGTTQFRKKVEEEKVKRLAEAAARRAEQAQDTLGALASSLVTKAEIRPSTRRGWESILKASIIPALGTLRAAAVSKEDVRRALTTIKARSPWAADSAHKLLTWVFRVAVERDLLPASPMAGLRRADFRMKDGGRRKVVPSPADLRAVWNAAGAAGVYGSGVRLAMLTLVRRSEVFDAEVAEFDIPGKVWRIPARRRKNAEPLSIPLADDAVTLTESLLAIAAAQGSKYLLPGEARADEDGERKEGPLRPTSKAWERLLIGARLIEAKKPKVAGAKVGAKPQKERGKWKAHPLRFHDLRRAGRSILETELEVSAAVAEGVLGHLAPSLSRTYSPEGVGLRERGRALDTWAAHLASIVSGEAAKAEERSAKVVAGRFGR